MGMRMKNKRKGVGFQVAFILGFLAVIKNEEASLMDRAFIVCHATRRSQWTMR